MAAADASMDKGAVARRTTDEAGRPSPLARGLAWRLGWALGLSGLLWLAVAWALS